METDWGELFYKRLGKQTRTVARDLCSSYGDSVHLPIPRLIEENDFYKTYFGHDSMWLGVSDSDQEGIFKSDMGDILHQVHERLQGEVTVSKFGWTNRTLSLNSTENGVKMSSSGHWLIEDENQMLESVCIFHVLHRDCSKCTSKIFCQYKKEEMNWNRNDIECICPDMSEGKYCESNKCLECMNGGDCILNNETNQIDCICPFPYHGKYCELGEINFHTNTRG